MGRYRRPAWEPYVRPWKKAPRPPELKRLRKKRKWLRGMIDFYEKVNEVDFQVLSWKKELTAVEDRIEYLEGKDGIAKGIIGKEGGEGN